VWSVRVANNGLRLGEGGDVTTELSYEAHTSNLRKTVIRSTEPPLLPNRCYQLPFCLSEVLSVVFAGSVWGERVRLLALSFAFAAFACVWWQKQM